MNDLSPTVIKTPWSRSTTVSTPDLKVENQNVGTDNELRRGIWGRLYPHRTKIHFYSQLIFIILNCIILAVGFVHVGAAMILTISEDTVLIVVKYWYYVAYVLTLYIDAIILIVVSLTGFWFVHRKSWKKAFYLKMNKCNDCNNYGTVKQYIACYVHIVGIMIILGTYQYRIHSNIQENVRKNMMASISTVREMPTNTRVAWDYVQKTLKCCGVDGQVDWCTRYRYKRNFGKLLGSYTCSLPVSCCNKDIDEILSSEKFSQYSIIDNYVPCSVLPSPSKVYNVGCFGHVTREVQYITNLLKFVHFVPALLLIFSTLTAMILSIFVLIDI